MVERRRVRQNSNVFHTLSKTQIVSLRDAFNLFDSNNDGILNEEDFSTFLNSIGSPLDETSIKKMIEEISPNKNFMTFVTILGEKMSQISDLRLIEENLKILSNDRGGRIKESELRRYLVTSNETTSGDEISEVDFQLLIKGTKLDDEMIDCMKLAKKIKHGEIIE